ncbi:unnamed protein product [Choristocarpus tenellus]
MPSISDWHSDWHAQKHTQNKKIFFFTLSKNKVCDSLVQSDVFTCREGEQTLSSSSSSGTPNHILLNEYTGGQGIGPHKDGSLYEGRVAILSLGSAARLEFWASLEDAKADCSAPLKGVPEEDWNGDGGLGREGLPQVTPVSPRAVASVLCEDCSLVVFEGEAYHNLWHGIVARVEEEGTDKNRIYDLDQPEGSSGNCVCKEGNEEQGENSLSAITNSAQQDGKRERKDTVLKPRQTTLEPRRLSFTVRCVGRLASPDSVIESQEGRNERERRQRFFELSVSDAAVAPIPSPAVTPANAFSLTSSRSSHSCM